MALYVKTTTPSGLLSKINKAIDDNKIETWIYDKDGDFTHTPPQWKYQAWMRPYVSGAALIFGIVSRNDLEMTKKIYGIYHGRFAEMLLTHFDVDFSVIETTAMPVSGIDVL